MTKEDIKLPYSSHFVLNYELGTLKLSEISLVIF